MPEPLSKQIGEGLPGFALKDSGKREQHASGMVRDTNEGKPRFDLMLPRGIPFDEQFLTRIAQHMAKGAVKYSPRNWEKANSWEEYERAKESANRHFVQWMAGERDEDHAAAVFFGLLSAETIRWKLLEAERVAPASKNLTSDDREHLRGWSSYGGILAHLSGDNHKMPAKMTADRTLHELIEIHNEAHILDARMKAHPVNAHMKPVRNDSIPQIYDRTAD